MYDNDLPADVLEQIHANKKINAIKILKERRGLGLKEAKMIVDAYIDFSPAMNGKGKQKKKQIVDPHIEVNPHTTSGEDKSSRMMLLFGIIILAAGAYGLFSLYQIFF